MASASAVFDEKGKAVSPTSAYGQRLASLLAASREIGDTARSRLSWIVQFITGEPTRPMAGDCLLALIGYGLPPNIKGGVLLPPPLKPAQVEAIHRKLKYLIQDAVRNPPGEPVWSSGDGLDIGLVRVSSESVKPAAWGLTYRSATLTVAAVRAVTDLIFRAGDRLIACRWCKEPLVAIKKQQFCNANEAQQFRNDKRRLEGGRSRHGKTKRTR